MTNLSDLTPGGGGGAGIDFQEFTTNGTWTKPDDVSWVKIEVIGGGGGGGSGRVGGNANGGNGGGGAGLDGRSNAGAGATNFGVQGTGGGGGGVSRIAPPGFGSSPVLYAGGAGGSGIVIISYPT